MMTILDFRVKFQVTNLNVHLQYSSYVIGNYLIQYASKCLILSFAKNIKDKYFVNTCIIFKKRSIIL